VNALWRYRLVFRDAEKFTASYNKTTTQTTFFFQQHPLANIAIGTGHFV
jgi:hypothetical protein